MNTNFSKIAKIEIQEQYEFSFKVDEDPVQGDQETRVIDRTGIINEIRGVFSNFVITCNHKYPFNYRGMNLFLTNEPNRSGPDALKPQRLLAASKITVFTHSRCVMIIDHIVNLQKDDVINLRVSHLEPDDYDIDKNSILARCNTSVLPLSAVQNTFNQWQQKLFPGPLPICLDNFAFQLLSTKHHNPLDEYTGYWLNKENIIQLVPDTSAIILNDIDQPNTVSEVLVNVFSSKMKPNSLYTTLHCNTTEVGEKIKELFKGKTFSIARSYTLELSDFIIEFNIGPTHISEAFAEVHQNYKMHEECLLQITFERPFKEIPLKLPEVRKCTITYKGDTSLDGEEKKEVINQLIGVKIHPQVVLKICINSKILQMKVCSLDCSKEFGVISKNSLINLAVEKPKAISQPLDEIVYFNDILAQNSHLLNALKKGSRPVSNIEQQYGITRKPCSLFIASENYYEGKFLANALIKNFSNQSNVVHYELTGNSSEQNIETLLRGLNDKRLIDLEISTFNFSPFRIELLQYFCNALYEERFSHKINSCIFLIPNVEKLGEINLPRNATSQVLTIPMLSLESKVKLLKNLILYYQNHKQLKIEIDVDQLQQQLNHFQWRSDIKTLFSLTLEEACNDEEAKKSLLVNQNHLNSAYNKLKQNHSKSSGSNIGHISLYA